MLSLLFLFLITMLAAGWPTEKPQSTTVRAIGQCKLQEDGGLKVKLKDEPAIIKFAADKIPTNIKGKKLSGEWMFAMNAKKDTIYSMIPAEGAFKAKFDSFATGKDEKLPQPHHITGPATNAQGQKYNKDYWQFTANCRIIDGDYEGFSIPYFLRYDPFFMSEDEGKQIAGIKVTKHGEKLLEFLDTVGVLTEPMPWSDNLLPALQKRILKADRTFTIVVKKGYIDSVISEEGVDFTDPDDADFEEPEKKEETL